MSIQPLQHFDNHNDGWQELAKLPALLSIQDTLDALLNSINHSFTQYVGCDSKLWLNDSFNSLIAQEGLSESPYLLLEKPEGIDQVIQEPRSFSELIPSDNNLNVEAGIFLALRFRDELIGVIHLYKFIENRTGKFSLEIIEYLCIHSAQALYELRQDKLFGKLGQKIDQLTQISQITKSVLSNLDYENLVPSFIALLHQRFGYSRVSIFILENKADRVFSEISISREGVAPSHFIAIEQCSGSIQWVFSHKKAVIIPDLLAEQRFGPLSSDVLTRSELIVPLLVGDIIIGVLELCKDVPNSLDDEALNLMNPLAEHFAIAIRNAILYRSEQKKRSLIDRIKETTGTASTDQSLDEILLELLKEAGDFLVYDAGAIWLGNTSDSTIGLEQFTSSLNLAAVHINENSTGEFTGGKITNLAELLNQNLPDGAGSIDLHTTYPWIAEIIDSGEPQIREASSSHEPLGGVLSFDRNYSAVASPLTVDHQSIGVVVFIDRLPNQYNHEAAALVGTFANYISVAIQNIRQYCAAHDQAWLATVQQQVTESTQSINSMDELVDSTANMLPELIGASGCIIYLFDASTGSLLPQSIAGFDEELENNLLVWDINPSSLPSLTQLIDSSIPIVFSSETITTEITQNIFPTYDFSSDLVILFPMVTQDVLQGAFLLDFSGTTFDKNAPQSVWDEKYALIQGIARQIAVEVENLTIMKGFEEEAYISVALLQVAQAIVSMSKLEEILVAIVRITPILVGIKRCIIYLWDDHDLTFHQAQSYGFTKKDLAQLGQVILSGEFPLVELPFQKNEIIYANYSVGDSHLNWNEISAGELHTVDSMNDSNGQISIRLDKHFIGSKDHLLIGLPLSVQDEVLGVMLIEEEEHQKDSPATRIREKRIEIVKGITQQAAIAIKNEHLQIEVVKSERMERELQLAREIQSTFLPDSVPDLPGWDLGIRWEPARQVAGDFYDFFLLDENRLGLVIADVADKGMPAALFMILIRTLIRSAAKEKISPAAVLQQVNELLAPDAKHGMFVTVFYAVISLETGIIHYANAGHNPPIIKRNASGEIIELSRTGMALGIFDEIDMAEDDVLLNNGDWLLLYTDGITEAFSADGEEFGTDRLFELIEESNFGKSRELLDSIDESIKEFIEGDDLSDDMTLAVLFRN